MKTIASILAVAFAIASAAWAADERAVWTWAGFETEAQVAKWKPLDTRFERSTRFATDGQHSARLHFKKYGGAAGEAQWPRVTAFGSDGAYPTDWSGWAAVALDLTTDAPQGTGFSVEIRDTVGKNGWHAPYSLQPETPLRVVIALSDVAKVIKMSHIAEFLIYKGRPEQDVYVDNVQLVSPKAFEMQTAIGAAATTLNSLWTRDGAAVREKAELAALQKDAASAHLTMAEAQNITDRARRLAQSIAQQRLKPLRAFDFGPAGSSVRDGFVGVSASTAFEADVGFGWRKGDGLKELARPAAGKWTMSYALNREVPPAVYLNELTQDLVGGTSPAEFVVNVPPGDYALWLLVGFPAGHEPMVNNFTVDAGAGTRRIGLPQQHIFESVFMPAKAGPEGLSVRFTPETGFVANALAVFALKDLRRARKEFAGPIEHEIFRAPPELWEKWRLVPHPPEKPAPTPTDEERQRG